MRHPAPRTSAPRARAFLLASLCLTLAATHGIAASPRVNVSPSTPPPDTVPTAVAGPEYSPDLPPATAGAYLVQALIAGDPPARIIPYFEEALAPKLTEEAVRDLHARLVWVTNILGDALQVFTEGSRPLPDGNREYFREYRFANEADRAHPIVVAQVMFADSLVNKASGIFVKTFTREPGERRLADSLTWKIGGRALHVHSIAVMELESEFVLFARVENNDTVSLADREAALPYTLPIARELAARGWLDSARALIADSKKPLIDEIGVLFMRVDPHYGYVHIRQTVRADEYAGPRKKGATKNVSTKKPSAKKTGARTGAQTGK
jgi:hypothetical protein